MDPALTGMLIECGKCQFLENIELTKNGKYRVQCFLFNEILIDKDKRCAQCKNRKCIRDLCKNFYQI